NLRFVSFDLRGFAARKRSVFQPVGDAVLLILLAAVNAGRTPTVATDFAAPVLKLAGEPRPLPPPHHPARPCLGLCSPNPRFVSFDLRGFAARNRSVFQPVGDAVLLILFAAINARGVCLRKTD